MKKCKPGYYYCYTDKVCKPLSKGMKVTARFSGGGREPEETGIDVPLNGNGNGENGGNGGTVSEEGLRDWFGKSKSKDGKKGWVNVVTGGTCASDEPGEGTPKCVSSAKRASMSKAERLSAQRRKKKADPGQQQKSGAAKPTYVSTDPKKKMTKEEILHEDEYRRELAKERRAEKDRELKRPGVKSISPGKLAASTGKNYADSQMGSIKHYDKASKGRHTIGNPYSEEVEVTEAKDKPGKGSGKKDACYNKVKSRYSVWPSAYASGALVKCRKVGAANWGNKSESYDFSNWREDFKALEIETVNLIEPDPIQGGQPIDEKCWVGYKQVGMKKKGDKVVPNCVKEEELNEIHKQAHTPHEVPSTNLKKLVKKAVTRIDTDADGDVDHNDKAKGELGEFIPGVGNKRLYSTTRPKTAKESFSDWRTELGEDWQKVNKGDKTDGMSQKAVNAYRRENPGSKLKTAVTGDPKPGSKDAKRRKSFCSRSKGQQDMHNIDCSKDPDKAICKARRRWKC
jgi:hypothetical protein